MNPQAASARANPRYARRTLLSPQVGSLILLCAAAVLLLSEHYMFVFESQSVLVSDTEGLTNSETPSASHDQKESASEDSSSMDMIRSIPIIGEQIAQHISDAADVALSKPRLSAKDAKKVKVELYMEAACPGCQFFTTHVLAPVLQEPGMADIMDLRIIPAGNAEIKEDEETKEESIDCQHGEAECEGNKILACLEQQYGKTALFMPTMSCIEEHASVIDSPFNFLSNITAVEMIRNNADICMKDHAIDVQAINQCSQSDQGTSMLRAAIQETQDLKPKLEYAPWVVVDGAPLKEDAYSLKEYICKAYLGPQPEACDPLTLKDYFPVHQLASRNAKTRRMTGSQARQDITSYFNRLDRQIRRSGAKNSRKMSATLQSLSTSRLPRFQFCRK